VPTLQRLGLALALGIFVGLERERRGKEAGVRTFGFAALLGCLGSLLGTSYALMCLALLGLPIGFLNWQRLRAQGTAELTTSVALILVGLVGILCGQGHTFTPVAVGIATAALLAWKEPLTGFSVGLTEPELRAAILMGILAFIVYPALPVRPLDPWALVEPRAAWATVILIAAIGFVNYILWKIYGAKGVAISGFLGGLVNSTVAVTELSRQAHEAQDGFVPLAYRGILLATAAMLLRNLALLGILAPRVLPFASVPLLLMLACGAALIFWHASFRKTTDTQAPTLQLTSPFSLASALRFGLVFVTLNVAGTLAQRWLGALGFYAVSIAGGLVSSASAVASAATLAAHGKLTPAVAANGAVLAAVASVFVNLPLVMRVAHRRPLTARLRFAFGIIMAAGLLGALLQSFLLPPLLRFFTR
jgi:uncharacterized membrane protein (DUF4010 family)